MKMKNLIKISAVFLSVMLFVNTANAQIICDPSCSVSIVFNPAGSLQAVEAMEFTFSAASELNLGATGTINTAVQPASMDFSAGGTLSLAAGDSITFGDNGFLSMASGSNINASSFNVVNGSVIINAASAVTLSGLISVDGELSITTQGLILVSDVQVSNDLLISSANPANSVILGGSGNIIIGSTGSITIDGSIIPSIGTISINDLSPQFSAVQLESQPLEDLSILEGYEINALDGTLCTVSGAECIAANGDVYRLVDGDLIKQEDDSGAFGIESLFFVLMVVLVFRSVRIKHL